MRQHVAALALAVPALAIAFLGAVLSRPIQAAEDGLALRLVERHVVPGYELFAADAAALDAAVGGWCGGETERAEVDAAFAEAFAAWAAIAHIDIGPVRYLDRRFRIQFWPDPRGLTRRKLRQAQADQVTDVTEASVAIQGFPALERLLTEPEAKDACPLIQGITHNLAAMSTAIVANWTDPGGFSDAVAQAGTGEGPFDTENSALSSLMTGVLAGLEGVSEIQLDRPLGTDLAKARPKRAEAWRSGLSLDLIRARLAAYEQAYLLDGGGLDAALRDAGHADLADLMTRAFAQTRATAASVEGPLAEAVADPARRATLETLVTEARALRALLVSEVAPALDVPPGFNSLDGD